MTYLNDINVTNLPVTAFGDLRVAGLSPIFQYSFEYTVDNTKLTTNTATNGGTITQASAMAVVSTSTTTASSALLTTTRHAKYHSGQGGLFRFTTLFTAGVASTEQYVGLADEVGSGAAFKNGYMIGFDGSTFGFHRFQNDTKISVTQASWDDPLDGTGDSGMTIDLTKLNVWEIRFQYLGAGAITLHVENDLTGKFMLVHTILYANNNITPSVHNPNFFGTLWVDNKATTNDLIIKSASMSYFIEGMTEFTELQQPLFSTGLITKTSVTAQGAIFTIRNKSTYASKTNFIDVVIAGLSASVEASAANNQAELLLVRNAILGGSPFFTDINTTDSVMEIDVVGTTITGGELISPAFLAGKNDSFGREVSNFKVLLGPGDALTVAAQSASSATIKASLLGRELF